MFSNATLTQWALGEKLMAAIDFRLSTEGPAYYAYYDVDTILSYHVRVTQHTDKKSNVLDLTLEETEWAIALLFEVFEGVHSAVDEWFAFLSAPMQSLDYPVEFLLDQELCGRFVESEFLRLGLLKDQDSCGSEQRLAVGVESDKTGLFLDVDYKDGSLLAVLAIVLATVKQRQSLLRSLSRIHPTPLVNKKRDGVVDSDNVTNPRSDIDRTYSVDVRAVFKILATLIEMK
jgi:hypothetical protein